MKLRLLFLFFAVVLFVTGHSILRAQEAKHKVAVGVTVMDPSGAVIVGAQLKISPPPDPPLKNPKTNEDGRFLVCLLPGGYDLYVSHPYFKPWSKHIEVADAPSHSVEVYLQLAQTTSLIDRGDRVFPSNPLHRTQRQGDQAFPYNPSTRLTRTPRAPPSPSR